MISRCCQLFVCESLPLRQFSPATRPGFFCGRGTVQTSLCKLVFTGQSSSSWASKLSAVASLPWFVKMFPRTCRQKQPERRLFLLSVPLRQLHTSKKQKTVSKPSFAFFNTIISGGDFSPFGLVWHFAEIDRRFFLFPAY